MAVKKHTCVFSTPTVWNGMRRCAYYPKCQEVRRVEKPAPAQEHSDTSKSAAASVEGSPRTRTRAAVLQAIRDAGAEGLTDEKGTEVSGIEPNTYRPRRIELMEQNLIVDSKKTRLTRSGRSATVYVAR